MARTVIGTRIFVALSTLLLAGNAFTLADDDRGRGGGHRGGGGGGNHFLDVSPWGVSYGFQNRNFGFSVGPIGGRAPDAFYAPAVVDPVYVPAGPPIGYSQPIISDYGYSQPIISTPVAPAVSSTVAPAANPAIDAPAPASTNFSPAAETFYRQSVEAFRSGDYAGATRASDHAIIEDSKSGFLRLHAAQCLFANGEFEASATALADGLAMLDKNEWGREIKNFRDLYRKNDYVSHMKRLEKFVADNPQAAFANALCAYHFNYLGHADAAKRHLTAARKVDANYPLVKLLSGVIEDEPAEELPAPVSILVPSK